MAELSTNKIKSFTDLIAWRHAHKLVLAVYKMTDNFPQKEIFGLTSQMRRASVSVSSNIAEGFSRNTHIDKKRFYTMSYGSVAELQNQMLIARDVGFITTEIFQQLSDQTIAVQKLIGGLKKSAIDKKQYT